MPRRISAPALLSALFLAAPALAQEADSQVPIIPAPGEQILPLPDDANLQTEPETTVPASGSRCSHGKQVMS